MADPSSQAQPIATKLRSGDPDYRSYVGGPGRYDVLAGAQFSFLLTRTGLPSLVTDWVRGTFTSPWTFLLAVNVFFPVVAGILSADRMQRDVRLGPLERGVAQDRQLHPIGERRRLHLIEARHTWGRSGFGWLHRLYHLSLGCRGRCSSACE